MANSRKDDMLSLQEVLSALKETQSTEFWEVQYAARMIVRFFKEPAHEITIGAIKYELRFFPLFLSSERLHLYAVEAVLRDVDRLISAAGEIRRTHLIQRLPSAMVAA